MIKFLPFDDDDLKRLDKLIKSEELRLPGREDFSTRAEWKKAYMKAYRLMHKLGEIEFKDKDLMRRSRV